MAILGTDLFANTLTKISNSDALLKVLSQFIEFNSVFAAGVANLAGEIAYRKEIFQDANDNIEAIADRSCDIAATIYFAAIDEFNRRETHRSKAADTLRSTVNFLGYSNQKVNELARLMPATGMAIKKVCHGYCLGKQANLPDLFKGLGFHIGSEILAVGEFSILHSYLETKHSALVKHLQSTNSYSWVIVHPFVERDHFQAAMESANLALRYYTGKKDSAKKYILAGLSNFVVVQTAFMKSLSKLISSPKST